MLLDTFYILNKDYGTTIQYVRNMKGTTDDDTGVHVDADKKYPIPAVISPTGYVTDFFVKLIGKVEKVETVFLIRRQDLPFEISPTDHFIHGNVKYNSLQYDDFYGVLYALTGEVNK